eukprot:15453724-Alexandrium_andersonii.AAC.1
MSASLVGSEMCIRDRSIAQCEHGQQADSRGRTASERPLGSRVTFRRVGPTQRGSQPASERHLRRLLRRAHEAAWVQRQGRRLDDGLREKVVADATKAGKGQLAEGDAWGAWAKHLAEELKGLLGAPRGKVPSQSGWRQEPS